MTAPTSDERREVAERLRDYAQLRDCWPFEAFFVRLNVVLFGDNGWDRTDGTVFEYLADLIDPSTSATTFTPGVGLETYPPFPIRLWKCARCGEETIMMYDEGEPVACPYCGAVVVSDDD